MSQTLSWPIASRSAYFVGATFALRLLTIRRYSLAVLETAVVVGAVAQVFARHETLVGPTSVYGGLGPHQRN